MSLTDLNTENTLINSLDVSLNTTLTNLNTLNTIDLDCITVADEIAANAGTSIYTNWVKDSTCNYNLNCNRPLSDSDFNVSEVYVGPNPIKEELHILMNDFTILKSVSIYDISGKLILKSSNTTISASHVKPGIYLVQVVYRKG